MHNNRVFSESVTRNNRPRKWWHRRWFKIIGICFIVLTIFAIILPLVYKRVIVALKEPKNTTIPATQPSTTISIIPLSTTTVPQLTTAISTIPLLTTATPLITTTTPPLITTTTPLTTTTTTIQQSGEP